MASRRYQVTLSGLRVFEDGADLERIRWDEFGRFYGMSVALKSPEGRETWARLPCRVWDVASRLQRRARRRAVAQRRHEYEFTCPSPAAPFCFGLAASLAMPTACVIALPGLLAKHAAEAEVWELLGTSYHVLAWATLAMMLVGLAFWSTSPLLIMLPYVRFVGLRDRVVRVRTDAAGLHYTRRSGATGTLAWTDLIHSEGGRILIFRTPDGRRRVVAPPPEHARQWRPLFEVLRQDLAERGPRPNRDWVPPVIVLVGGALGTALLYFIEKQGWAPDDGRPPMTVTFPLVIGVLFVAAAAPWAMRRFSRPGRNR